MNPFRSLANLELELDRLAEVIGRGDSDSILLAFSDVEREFQNHKAAMAEAERNQTIRMFEESLR